MSKLTSAPRLVFLDVLRLIAAAQMIQGHSVAAVLAPDYAHGLGHTVWTFARGLTSVLFLTTAGFAFVLAEQRAHHRVARVRRCRRALRLVAIGYAMHAPLGMLFGVGERELGSALVVDVLQCIGVSLLALELLTFAVTNVKVRCALALLSSLACFGLAPLSRELTLEGPLALALGQYLTARYGSLFPLVPWAGYVFAGFFLASVPHRLETQPTWLASAGAVCLALGLALLGFGPALPLALSPGYALVKLGTVALLAGLLARLCARVTALPSLCARLASETLFLYVSHVVILYADGVGLEHRLGHAHGPWFGLALALLLGVACSAGALGFRALVRSLRGSEPGSTRGAQLP